MSITEQQFQALLENQRRAAGAPPPKITRKRNKYGVSPAQDRTVMGRLFASKAEASAYSSLLMLMKAGEITNLELQPRFAFPTGFAYVGDFRVTYKDGRQVVIDVKGVETPVFKLKRKCLAYFYPDVALELWKSCCLK